MGSAARSLYSRGRKRRQSTISSSPLSKLSPAAGPPCSWCQQAGAVVSAGLLVSFFGEASWSPEGRMARRAPFEPTFLIFFAWALWLSVARINAAGKRLTSLAVGVSSSRIPLKGMLGRTSWCNYFMSMEICVTLGNGTAVDPVAAFQGPNPRK